MSSPSHQANSFDALRLVAALMVVVGHAYILSGRAETPFLLAFVKPAGLGEFGVSIFFVISGFLVTASLLRLGDARAYLAHRLLRILPGLAVATVLTALVLGPLVTRLPAGAYFADARTWLYPVRNTLLYPVTYVLPGVFDANPYPVAVNGSLWTLRLEFTFYLVPPLMAAARQLDRRGTAVLAAAALAVYLAVVFTGLGAARPILLIAARNFHLFAAGAALYMWREAIRPQRAAVLAGALVLFGIGVVISDPLAVAVLPLVVIGLALTTLRGVSGPVPFGDLSYGVYIYAFPVQQTLMHLFGPQMGVGPFLAATLALVLPLAAASWWLVERPALKLKTIVDRKAA